MAPLMQAMQDMTPEQAKMLIEQMSPEQRMQMQRMQEGMVDLKHLCDKLKPSAVDPDAEVSLLQVVRALASAPIMSKLPTEEEQRAAAESALAECDDATLAKVEAALVEAKAFEAEALAECEAVERRNVLLLYFHMHQSNMPELSAAMPGGLEAMRGYINSIATKLLIKAQMLMPQQRWVQPTLAIARASALIATALWSHEDEKGVRSAPGPPQRVPSGRQRTRPTALRLPGASPDASSGASPPCAQAPP